jgi:dTDP-4-dehydrorhamnose reductase
MKILGTGLAGLVGSRIVELLSSHSFENISRSSGVDIADREQVFAAVDKSDAEVILHLAAKANVEGCEKDKSLGHEGEAWKINVEGTRHVVQAAETYGKKIVYISTDFVFDGEKQFYTEDDTPHPLNWYAQTKYEGEKIVKLAKTPWIIARIAYPYRAAFPKNDFVRAVKQRLESGQEVTMVTDHIMAPTFIDDLVYAVEKLCTIPDSGIYHVVGSQFLSPYDATFAIATLFDLNKTLIKPTTREVFFQGRAPRPFRLALKNDKIRQLGMQMSSFDKGLEKLKGQL